jgi:alkanesulfonate monooxygenase SsuD/methylene tetrahydromethanopterin reductase-like flavin-dependent oxidoreductase (luciferase family)
MTIARGSLGLNIDPSAADVDVAFRLAELADTSGIDFVGVQDHLYHRGFLDAWTLLTTLASRTTSLTVMPNVATVPLRPPAPLIKAASTLSLLTGGRVALGVGSGAMAQGIAAYGGPARSTGDAVTAFEEALRVMRAMSDPQRRSVTFTGSFHQLHGAHPGPLPAAPVPLLIGSYGSRMLRLTGRFGDGWLPTNSYAPPARVPKMQSTIDDAAVAAGRDPRQILRVYNVMGAITGGPGEDGSNLTGPAEFWVDALVRYREELGFDSFLFWPVGADPVEQTHLFIERVAPALGPAPHETEIGKDDHERTR